MINYQGNFSTGHKIWRVRVHKATARLFWSTRHAVHGNKVNQRGRYVLTLFNIYLAFFLTIELFCRRKMPVKHLNNLLECSLQVRSLFRYIISRIMKPRERIFEDISFNALLLILSSWRENDAVRGISVRPNLCKSSLSGILLLERVNYNNNNKTLFGHYWD